MNSYDPRSDVEWMNTDPPARKSPKGSPVWPSRWALLMQHPGRWARWLQRHSADAHRALSAVPFGQGQAVLRDGFVWARWTDDTSESGSSR